MIPLHLYWARLLLENILAGNGVTMYRHSNGPVQWGPTFASITDCSGFINALLEKSYNLMPKDWSNNNRAYVSTYYKAINGEFTTKPKYFTKITNIYDARIGDFIVFRILPGTSGTDNTGHIMIINAKPIRIAPSNLSNPSNNNLHQWIINIIDQSSAHGKLDSRKNGSNGLGTGYLKIYTEVNGNLRGYSWSDSANSKYIDSKTRPLVIARLVELNI